MNIKNLGKLFGLLLVAILIITIGKYTTNKATQTDTQVNTTNPIPLPALPTNKAGIKSRSTDVLSIEGIHVRGSQNPQVYLIEFSDMDCPYCRQFHKTVQELLIKRDDVAWVYKHFPLTNLHPEAQYKSYLAECVAREKGEEKFWEFTDRILAGEPSLKILTEMGVQNAGECAEDPTIQEIVEADVQLGTSLGAQGTPFVVLQTTDGKTATLPGAVSLEVIEKEITKLLGK